MNSKEENYMQMSMVIKKNWQKSKDNCRVVPLKQELETKAGDKHNAFALN